MKVTVLGAGESGVGAALLAQHLGYEVFVSDTGLIKDNFKRELADKGIPNEESKHTWTNICDSDLIIKSPGIPDATPLILKLIAQGIPVISEIEFACRHTTAPIIGITGSNGKTTTTRLTYHLLKTAGLNVGIGGNIGYSFARNITENKYDYHVLELSSFQLDGITSLRPKVAILLNITPDHLDRYEYKMENYVRSKFRIAMNQQEDDLLILNADDIEISRHSKFLKLGVSNNQPRMIKVSNHFENTHSLKVGDSIFDMQKCVLKGPHNFFNAACAIHAAKFFDIKDEAIQEGLNTFVNDPHRLEMVATFNGVDYINDSKATNVDSVYQALRAMEKPIVWVAGGTDKGNDYSPLKKLVEEKVKALICLGKDNQKLLENFSPILKNIEETKSAKEAVKRASIYAENGDVVLLSPACASFDLFKNYMDRGDQFKAAVLEMKN
ncbi:MAG: UDP-N-acetylmuramoyl-L-alanine--D-glutamate ligase [Saprospiraceae bacterium]